MKSSFSTFSDFLKAISLIRIKHLFLALMLASLHPELTNSQDFFSLKTRSVHGDIKSNNGQINFDVNSDSSIEVTIGSNGLGIGTTTVNANLHLVGNAVIESGKLTVGASTTGNSSLEIHGSIGFGIQTLSSNATLSGNSIVMADTSNANILLTLPYAGNVMGRTYTIKKITNTNKLWIAGGGNSIDELGSVEVSSSGNGFPFINTMSDGQQWYITSQSEGINTIASDNLVGWWKLNETSGNTASDSSGQGISGNLIDGMTFSGNGSTGTIGNALSFDGSGDEINAGDPAILDFSKTTPQSVSLWYKRDVSGVRHLLLAKQVGGGAFATSIYSEIGTDDKFLIYLGHDTGTTNIQQRSTNAYADTSSWHHYAYTYNGGGAAADVKMYVDGVEVATTVVSDNLSSDTMTNSAPFKIGGRDANNLWWDGLLDDVRIYNRTLTTTEIQALYQKGQ